MFIVLTLLMHGQYNDQLKRSGRSAEDTDWAEEYGDMMDGFLGKTLSPWAGNQAWKDLKRHS